MDKEKISRRPKSSSTTTHKLKPNTRRLKAGAKVKKHEPRKTLLDENLVAEAVWECLKNNDPEGVVEVIQAHLSAVNKSRKSTNSNLPRSTLYSGLKRKNPTVKTLAKMINCLR